MPKSARAHTKRLLPQPRGRSFAIMSLTHNLPFPTNTLGDGTIDSLNLHFSTSLARPYTIKAPCPEPLTCVYIYTYIYKDINKYIYIHTYIHTLLNQSFHEPSTPRILDRPSGRFSIPPPLHRGTKLWWWPLRADFALSVRVVASARCYVAARSLSLSLYQVL